MRSSYAVVGAEAGEGKGRSRVAERGRELLDESPSPHANYTIHLLPILRRLYYTPRDFSSPPSSLCFIAAEMKLSKFSAPAKLAAPRINLTQLRTSFNPLSFLSFSSLEAVFSFFLSK